MRPDQRYLKKNKNEQQVKWKNSMKYLLPTKGFAEQHKRYGNGNRLSGSSHSGSQRSSTSSHQRQNKLNTKIAGKAKQQGISIRLNWVLKYLILITTIFLIQKQIRLPLHKIAAPTKHFRTATLPLKDIQNRFRTNTKPLRYLAPYAPALPFPERYR